ncbi:MAG: MATE family efflux transporter [Erysipelotrichaceae bacterium]|nr:MATE family efflux transporter [Erysipelotrichaceae bacterium]
MHLKKHSLFQYTWPIFIELLLQILIGNIDQMMIAADSQNGVAAIGNANTIFNFLIIMFSVISLAMSILVTQYIGSKQEEKVSQTYVLSLLVNLVIGLIIAFILIQFQVAIFSWMQLPHEILNDAKTYLTIIAFGLPIQAVYLTYVTMFRTQGWMKQTMLITTLVNVLNIFGNYLLIFGIGPFPALHVAGVAISSVVSRTFGLFILMYCFKRQYQYPLSIHQIGADWSIQLKKILSIGLPSAGEGISYDLSQIVIMKVVNGFGTAVINTKIYVSIFATFSYVYANAISQAAQIIVGYLVGARKYEETHTQVMKTMIYSVVISILISTILYLSSDFVLSFFTNDPYVLSLGKQIFFIEIFLEIGRAVNMTMVRVLQACGDIQFPVTLGIVSMWGVAVVLSYIFGIYLQLGLVGVWLAMACDELFRAVLFIIRWFQGGWKSKNLISAS